MQNTDAAERDNDTKLHDQPATPITDVHDASAVAAAPTDAPTNATIHTAQNGCDKVNGDGGGDGDVSASEPASKKRKLDDSDRPSRPPSPPWKKIEAEGPTSFVVDGRRKSGRTNTLPPTLTPGTDKRRTTRGAGHTPATGRGSAKQAALRHDHNGAASNSASRASKGAATVGRSQVTSMKTPTTKPTRKYTKAADLSHTQLAHQVTPATNGVQRKSRAEPTSTPNNSTRRRSGRTTEANNNHAANETPNGHSDSLSRPNSPTSSRTPRIKLRFAPMELPILHPGSIVPEPKYSSFSDFLQHDDPLTGEETQRMTPETARKEAQLRLRILDAAKPGGILSEERCSKNAEDAEEEPQPQYGPWQHIAAHACHFKTLLDREHRVHVQSAKKLAHEAVEEVRRRQLVKQSKAPVTTQELEAQQQDFALKRYKQLIKDLDGSWNNARGEVSQRRFARWQEQERKLGKKALDEMLGQSERLLKGFTDRVAGDDEETEDRDSDAMDEDLDTETSGELDPNVMSSDDDEDDGFDDDDANLTQDQLRAKYAHLQQDQSEEPFQSEDDLEYVGDHGEDADASDSEMVDLIVNGNARDSEGTPDQDAAISDHDPLERTNGAHEDVEVPQLEEVDPALMDDDDEMDSGSATEASSEIDSDDRDDDSEDQDDADNDAAASTTWGFFSESELAAMKRKAAEELQEGLQDDVVEEIAVEEEQEAEAQENRQENGCLPDTSAPHQNGDTVASTVNQVTVAETVEDAPAVATEAATPEQRVVTRRSTDGPSDRDQVPNPSLLRGTLRPYQQDGLNWLARLYNKGLNGILADEMGLGKTIQTIALLAHLAVDRGIWGTHLVVVPTSVVLNWEMEFKKFCPGFKVLPYVGSAEERKRKRKGWGNANSWNVVITSYQLILADAAAFKKRAWHYLILDEAHNIKNFQTQRWQTLLNFRTAKRLLLTGTPLQNNLQELWSLLFFLMPAGTDGKGGFTDLAHFNNALWNPSKQILEQGRQQLDQEAQHTVNHLHTTLRPYLLRRLKSEVEKQMPGKYEHVVYCRLSKRQRQLYDEFMGRADTKATLSGGNYMSIMNCLMSLRKVCNHPDLFETRQIVTSCAWDYSIDEKSVPAKYEPKDFFIRRRMLKAQGEKVDLDHLNLLLVNRESTSASRARRIQALQAVRPLEDLIERQTRRIKSTKLNGASISTISDYLEDQANRSTLDHLRQCLHLTRMRSQRIPVYGTALVERLTVDLRSNRVASRGPQKGENYLSWFSKTPSMWLEAVPTLEERALSLETTIGQFGCITPTAVCRDLLPLTLGEKTMDVARRSITPAAQRDPFHESRVRLSIAFPDKRLLQWDCGKLQRLALLLRDLQAGGHRALIFTQMTKVLDILEQFLNIHGHRYLRLDGSTKIEQRQMLTERFNKDPRILAFILSSRSGGLGINLTGADTVIFYDLDWNPAMDAQCQDRCHRIGQTRDVHIYRFVSEYTIEANILRKSNQKRLLDDVIIQKGDFTTDYFNKLTYKDALEDITDDGVPDDDATKAVDMVLGDMGKKAALQALDTVEDKEDVAAAKETMRDIVTEVHADDADFDESAVASEKESSVPPQAQPAEDKELPHVDEAMVEFLEWELRDVPLQPPKKRRRDRGGEHRVRRKR
ncbi:hypothetical protein K490DRAFT_34114 [Saccharata proteae CBS 121410]|uniref:DNA helicase n=1 Tax=Saccharata proteae CBS 121410 TaxID=1314787 RepID=A0A9P4LZC2_9PEZI|nr:hypothetical protein K490DRAFT_34114 [Saccharata proteae CBS 121410]